MKPCPIVLAVVAALALGGCGGDDESDEHRPATPPATGTQTEAPPPATTETETEPEAPAPDDEPSYTRTPRSLADCIGAADGVSDVLVKGRGSEDATYFGELVGGRVDVLGVTLEGQSAEIGVFLFASPADAKKAAPGAGGGGLEVGIHGSALVVAPPAADIGAIERCLAQAKYASG